MSNPLTNIVENVKNAIEAAISGLENRVNNIAPNIVQQLRDELNRMQETARNIANAVSNAVSGAINSATQTAQTIANGIQSGITNLANATTNAVTGAIENTRNAVTSAVQNASSLVNSAVETTKNAVTQAVNAAQTLTQNAINTAKQGIENAVNTAQSLTTSAINAAKQGIESAVNAASNFAANVATNVKDGVTALGISIYNGINGLAERIRDSITNSISATITSFMNVVGEVYVNVRNAFEAINAVYERVSAFIATSVNEGIRQAGLFVYNTVEALKENFNRGVEFVNTNVNRALEFIQNFIQTKVAELITFVETQYEITVELLKGYLHGFRVAIEGLWKYIDNSAGFIGHGALGAIDIILSGDYDDITGVVKTLSSLFADNNLPYAFFASVALSNVIGSAIPIVASPYLQKVQNRAFASALSGRLAVETIAQAIALRAIDMDTGIALAAKSGISASELRAIVASNEEKLSLSQIVNGYYDGNIDYNTAKELAYLSGCAVETFEYAIQLAKPVVSDSQIVNATYQGVISVDDARSMLARRGYSDKDIQIQFAQNLRNLGLEAIIELVNREFLTIEQARTLLRESGYRERDIDYILALTHRLPSLSDLIRFGLKDVFNAEYVNTYQLLEELPEEFVRYGKMYGLKEHEIKWYWASSWNLPSNTQGYEMYHRRIINREQLAMLLKFNDVPAFWREKMIEMAYNPLTRVDVRRMYQTGVIGEKEVYEAYLDLGYNPENARRLTEFTKRLSAQEDEDEQSKQRTATKAEILNAYRNGIITRDDAKLRLRNLRYSDDDIDLFLRMSDAGAISDEAKRANSDILRRTLNYVENAFKDNFLSAEAAIALLRNAGLSDQQAQSYVTLFALENDYEDDMKVIKALERAYEKYAIDSVTARNLLRNLGMSEEGIQAQLDEMDLLRLLNARIPTISEAKRWYKNGLIPKELLVTILLGNDVSDVYIDYYLKDIMGESE